MWPSSPRVCGSTRCDQGWMQTKQVTKQVPHDADHTESYFVFGFNGGIGRRRGCRSAAPSALPLVGVSTWTERGRQHNDRTLADGAGGMVKVTSTTAACDRTALAAARQAHHLHCLHLLSHTVLSTPLPRLLSRPLPRPMPRPIPRPATPLAARLVALDQPLCLPASAPPMPFGAAFAHTAQCSAFPLSFRCLSLDLPLTFHSLLLSFHSLPLMIFHYLSLALAGAHALPRQDCPAPGLSREDLHRCAIPARAVNMDCLSTI